MRFDSPAMLPPHPSILRHPGARPLPGIPTVLRLVAAVIAGLSIHSHATDFADWTVFIANDTCPDYTWGETEVRTRRNFAELVRSHLDEMNRTDGQAAANRDHYNMAVTQEALCFVEAFPARKAELIRRIQEGRVLVSPFLCNTLWGAQNTEAFLRSLYPARRLERAWHIPIAVAHHIECPSLPWGAATLLAGCGVRWVNVPFYDFDSTFSQLRVPPAFWLEGPDGSRVRVLMDAFASETASYAQGAHLLGKPAAITNEWLPHYAQLGAAWPLKAVLASGTHSDTHAGSAGQSRGFAEAIAAYNAGPPPRPRLVNATLADFFQVVDAAEAQQRFLPVQRGCFGHSWELWPVALAAEVVAARQNGRDFLAAETLLAATGRPAPQLAEATQPDRERAEWCWAMLGDHAWNGTDDANRRENARLRHAWNSELAALTQGLRVRAEAALGATATPGAVTLFNPLSLPRAGLVALVPAGDDAAVWRGRDRLPAQVVSVDGQREFCFVSPRVAGWAAVQLRLKRSAAAAGLPEPFHASDTSLEGPFYSLAVDLEQGGLRSLLRKPAGAELLAPGARRSLGQTIFWDGREHTLTNVRSQLVAVGPVLARLKITGEMGGLRVTNFVTLYAQLDQVDFDVWIHKPVTTVEQRLVHVFPVVRDDAVVRVETPAAVIRPYPQPRGDLLPGADPRRFAVQGFVDVSTADAGVTVAPLDAFALRMDLEPLSFEALGNDQDYKEVFPDQGGITEFRFRYVVRGHAGGYQQAEAVAWSRSVATPWLVLPGRKLRQPVPAPPVVDPGRAVATCFKPADGAGDGSVILRLWEIAGQTGPTRLQVPGCRRAWRTDLLERDLGKLPVRGGMVELDLNAYGLASARLLR